MDFRRIRYTLRLWTISSGKKRVEFMKKKGIYKSIGENVSMNSRKIPLYDQLIQFHNNIRVSSVTFITHDTTHMMINRADPSLAIQEKVGCIEVMDNVFIGGNTTILYGVRIGPNAVVAAGSLVNKDVPPNSVVAGVPARVIGTFDDFVAKRAEETQYPEQPVLGKKVGEELVDYLWNEFYRERESKISLENNQTINTD